MGLLSLLLPWIAHAEWIAISPAEMLGVSASSTEANRRLGLRSVSLLDDDFSPTARLVFEECLLPCV
jgi:hypothetical protein